MNNININQLPIIGVSIGSSLFASAFFSIFFNVFYMFYIQSKYSALRVKASTSFPKNQILTSEMIEAEMMRQDPEYGKVMQNFLPRLLKTFIITFLILLVLSYLGFNSAIPFINNFDYSILNKFNLN
jgi:hypothetical protein